MVNFIKCELSNGNDIHKTNLYETHRNAFMAIYAYKNALSLFLVDLPFLLFTPLNILFIWRTYYWVKTNVFGIESKN